MAGLASSIIGGIFGGKKDSKNYEGMMSGLGSHAASGLSKDGTDSVEGAMENLNTEFMIGNKLSEQAAGGYQGPGMVAGYAQDDGILLADPYTINPLPTDTSSIKMPALTREKNRDIGVLYKGDTTRETLESKGYGKQSGWYVSGDSINPDTGKTTLNLKSIPPQRGYKKQNIGDYLKTLGLNLVR